MPTISPTRKRKRTYGEIPYSNALQNNTLVASPRQDRFAPYSEKFNLHGGWRPVIQSATVYSMANEGESGGQTSSPPHTQGEGE